jgi:hypothetical protein
LPLHDGFSCKIYLQHLSKIYFRKHAFCFLPVVVILESSSLSLSYGLMIEP